MMVNIFIGASPFYWEHIGIAYIYGAICEVLLHSHALRIEVILTDLRHGHGWYTKKREQLS